MPNTQIVIHSIKTLELNDQYNESNLDTDILDHLKDKKSRKLMSKQDKLGLMSAASSWKSANLKYDQDKVGIYFCVGILPFEDKHLTKLAEYSSVENHFDYYKFSTDGFNSMNPLLTFKCLPNMPLFHISYNLDITGRYFMTYPSSEDLICSLERAIEDIEYGDIDYAIIGGACDQQNILVRHHLNRISKRNLDLFPDCSGAITISKKSPVKGDIIIKSINSHYLVHNPIESTNQEVSNFGAVDFLFQIQNFIQSSSQSCTLSSGHSKIELEKYYE